MVGKDDDLVFGKNMTIAIDRELMRRMKKYPEVNYTRIARVAFLQYVKMREGSVKDFPLIEPITTANKEKEIPENNGEQDNG